MYGAGSEKEKASILLWWWARRGKGKNSRFNELLSTTTTDWGKKLIYKPWFSISKTHALRLDIINNVSEERFSLVLVISREMGASSSFFLYRFLDLIKITVFISCCNLWTSQRKIGHNKLIIIYLLLSQHIIKSRCQA